MKSNSTAEIGKPKTSLGGVVKVDPSRRLIDLTVGELLEINAAQYEEFFDGEPKPLEDGLLDRAGAAKFLGVSTAQIDVLCREKALPFYRIGDCKRMIRTELLAWVKTQASK